MVSKPNIIFILSDQQRWDTLGCYGQPLDITPNLDSMAIEGVRFEYAFTNQPLCGPIRSVLQTGKYATQTGCFRNGIALKTNEKTIAHYLSDAGYEVGYLGKWHLASTSGSDEQDADFRCKAVPFERRGGYKDYWLASDILEFTSHAYDGHMFDTDMKQVYFPVDRYRADCLTDFAIDYLSKRDAQKPFFLFLSYVEPHHQNDRNCYEGPIGSKEKYKNFVVPEDLIDSEGDWRQSYPDYLGCCASVDYNVGRIRKQLQELKLADNTIIIYTSDHGSHFRTRNSEYKRSCHEGCIRVPLIIFGPGFSGGKVLNELVSLIDLPPTLMRIAECEIPKILPGNPLQQIINGSNKHWPEDIFVQISESLVGRCIRTRRWKYAVRAPEKDGGKYPFSEIYIEQFLYDLVNDSYEKNNLIENTDYTDIKKQLRQQLKTRIISIEGYKPRILPVF